MERDPYYWRQHKVVYLNEVDELDSSILNLIEKSPRGDEAREFERRVHRLTKESLHQEYHS